MKWEEFVLVVVNGKHILFVSGSSHVTKKPCSMWCPTWEQRQLG